MSQERDEVSALLRREVDNHSATDLEARAYNLISQWEMFENPEPEAKPSTLGEKIMITILVASIFGALGSMVANLSIIRSDTSSIWWKTSTMQRELSDIDRQLDSISRKLP